MGEGLSGGIRASCGPQCTELEADELQAVRSVRPRMLNACYPNVHVGWAHVSIDSLNTDIRTYNSLKFLGLTNIGELSQLLTLTRKLQKLRPDIAKLKNRYYTQQRRLKKRSK